MGLLDQISIRKMENVFHAKTWGLNWGNELINELKQVANQNKDHRARLCLHPSINDEHQEMLIVMNNLAIEKPQRRTIGFDTKLVLEGKAKLNFFDASAKFLRFINLGGSDFLYTHTNTDEFHALEIISEWFVFLEILKGPFTPETTEFLS